MRNKGNHITEPFKLTVFRSFEEMKAAPFSFPSDGPLSKRHAEREQAFSKLRSAATTEKDNRIKKGNKHPLK
jgi:hypothetical protein